MEQNLLGGTLDLGPARDSIQGRASEIPAALSMVLRFMWWVILLISFPLRCYYSRCPRPYRDKKGSLLTMRAMREGNR